MNSAAIRERIQRIKDEDNQRKLLERMAALADKFIVFWNTKRKGKTTSMIKFARVFRDNENLPTCGRPVIVVAQSMGVKESFGRFDYLSIEDFICQMRAISDNALNISPDLTPDEIEDTLLNVRGCSLPQHDPDYVMLANGQWKHRDVVSEKALERVQEQGEPCFTSQNGVIIYRTIMLIDESNELLGGEGASNPVTRMFSKFIQMVGHYRITLITSAPDPSDIAPKIRRQVDTYGQCTYFKDAGYIKVAFDKHSVWKGKMADGWQLQYNPEPYWEMFESFNLLQLRNRTLSIASKYY